MLPKRRCIIAHQPAGAGNKSLIVKGRQRVPGHDWPLLRGLVLVASTREIGAKIKARTDASNVTSRLANLLGPVIRVIGVSRTASIGSWI
jgi:hypothetical protein